MLFRARKPKSKKKTSRRQAVPFRARAHTVKSAPIEGPLIREPRLLLLDTENSPLLAYTWGRWQTNVADVRAESFLMSFAWKWLGQKRSHCRTLADYPGYNKNKTDDRDLLCELHGLIDAADIIIGHNLDRYDLRKVAARCAHHNLPPPCPSKTVDTLKLARRHFSFSSNKLDDLGKYLGLGRKLEHEGIELWLACMNGDGSAWKKMRAYNIQDVVLLEKVYLRLRAWAKSHPDLSLWNREEHACPTCQSRSIERRGFLPTRKSWKERLHCLGCGAWWSVRL